jgi:hypothetical protein
MSVTSCRDRVTERPVSRALATPVPSISALQRPTFSSPMSTVLPTPFAPTATTEAEREMTTTPLATSVPVSVVALTPTPVYTMTSVMLPRECYETLPKDKGDWAGPCTGFEFSPDGRFLGFFFGPDYCGSGINILDTRTGEIVYHHAGGGFGFEFLENGKILLATGQCEGGGMSLFDPIAGTLSSLGGLGRGGWNVTRTAIAVEALLAHMGLAKEIWGYNVEKDFLFLPPAETGEQLDNQLLWTPDGSHILFVHRPISYTSMVGPYTFLEASSIIRVSATTGERKVLVSDPRYDYHFCAAYSWCDNWYGDWIQVRRFPFEQQTLALFDPATDCLGYGEDCDEPPELFALNWRTGELIPWGEISLSAFTPISAHPDAADLFVP